MDVDRSGLVRIVGACVGSVVVINDVGIDLLVRAHDLHHERISSVVSGITIIIDSVDGELCWFVVPHVMEPLSLSPTLARIASPFDFGVERRIFDGISVQPNIDVVLSRRLDCIFNCVCSVSIIVEMRGDCFWSGDFHLIRISSLVNWMSISINGMNSEIARLLCLSSMKTRTFSIRMSCIGLLHQWMIRTAFDGLSIEFYINSISSGNIWGIASLIISILVVIELNENWGTMGIGDMNRERISSSGNLLSVGVERFNGERSSLVDTSTLNTRTMSIAMFGIRTCDGGMEGRILNLGTSESNVQVEVPNVCWHVVAVVCSVIVVNLIDMNGSMRSCELDLVIIPSGGQWVAKIID